MKKYDSYRDSGIEWIGEIPKHWKVKRLKHIVKEPLKYGANEVAEGEDIKNPRYIRITDFGNDGKLKDDTFKSLPHNIAENFLLEDGDLLFARSGATVGKTFLFKNFNGKACFAGYLIKASFDKSIISSAFINYVTKSNFYENWKLSVFQQATIQNIGADKYNQLTLTLPNTIEEQTAIANYLDQKTTQIDELISKKLRLIELLQEERTAMINQAVTKGLNPNVEMKDSGIEWLGEIPEHWEVKKLKHIADKITDGEHISPNFIENGVPFLSAKDVRDRIINYDVTKFVSCDDAEKFRKRCNPEIGDILIVSRGATIGRIGLVEVVRKFCLLGSVILVKPNTKVESLFLYYLLNTSVIQEVFLLTSQSSAQQALYLISVSELEVPLPALLEQTRIVKYLSDYEEKHSQIITKTEYEIDLLKEYKTALISEVVTGKVDIRNGKI